MSKTNNVIDRMLASVRTAIYGYDKETELVAYSIIADGHTVLKSVPGLAKTLMMKGFCRTIGGADFKRIQMTPNLLGSDIVGSRIINPKTNDFEIEQGPAFTNLLLADEINRATPKSQAALLEAMAEKSITIAGKTFPMHKLYFVCATMNPIEQEGTYPLPEAQLDRFLFEIGMTYVSAEAELAMVENPDLRGRDPLESVKQVVTIDELLAARLDVQKVYVARAAYLYIINLVRATRPGLDEFKDVVARAGALGATYGESIELGGSPRAINALAAASQARAYHKGRDHVRPEDVQYVLKAVLRHRLILTRKAKMNKTISPDGLLDTLLKTVKFHDAKDGSYAPKS